MKMVAGMLGMALPVALALTFSQAHGAPEEAEQRAQQAPSAGQLQREIQQQTLVRSLGDGIAAHVGREPDQPYEVIDGGMPLPRELCEHAATGCHSAAQETQR
ncbi:hypothetical protein [Billgrantia endophytica]|uniref:DUF1318 domain-containing protein n=1 Tax=Billgrantia endophytica TaxID=2033802 RepID=A0A2N7TUS0_9GAMM|nr:hypothetical protein [Halomonas endophytica]PMR71898.1 hypothetical protein C1H69_22720 [Halomonas endophytica]